MAASGVADTSWLYAILDANDEFHRQAVAQATKQAEIHVPVAVLVETLGLVRFRASRTGQNAAESLATVRAAVDSLERRANMRLGSPAYNHEAARRIWDHHSRLSFPDAVAIAAARREATDLLTFDEAQRAAHHSGKP